MRRMRRDAAKVLERLRALAVEARPAYPYVKVDRGGPGIMAVSVERVAIHDARELWAVAHYFEQNGDLCADPSVEFLRAPSGWFPTSFEQTPWPGYRVYVELDEELVPQSLARREQADCASFCRVWLRNVKEQQQLSA